MSLLTLLYLYISFRIKHFVGDFLLQSNWMAVAKAQSGQEGCKALFLHSIIHAVGTLLIVLFFAPALWWLAAVDFVLHAIIDRLKGLVTQNWGPKDTKFWWALGFEQELHNFTHLGYIVNIVLYKGGIIL
jgi:hypothetical protein